MKRKPVPKTAMKVAGRDQTGNLSSLAIISDAFFSSIPTQAELNGKIISGKLNRFHEVPLKLKWESVQDYKYLSCNYPLSMTWNP